MIDVFKPVTIELKISSGIVGEEMENNLTLCLAASGGGLQANFQIPASSLCTVATTANAGWYESLELSVGFQVVGLIGQGLIAMPEPACKLIGFVLSLPSLIMWMWQACIVVDR